MKEIPYCTVNKSIVNLQVFIIASPYPLQRGKQPFAFCEGCICISPPLEGGGGR